MKIEERNRSVAHWLDAKLTRAKSLLESDFKKLKDAPEASAVLTDLIETSAKGFRGGVLTSLAGYHLDPTFFLLAGFLCMQSALDILACHLVRSYRTQYTVR